MKTVNKFLKQYWMTILLLLLVTVLVYRSCSIEEPKVIVVGEERLDSMKNALQDTIGRYELMLKNANVRIDSLNILVDMEREARESLDSAYRSRMIELRKLNDDEQIILLYENLKNVSL